MENEKINLKNGFQILSEKFRKDNQLIGIASTLGRIQMHARSDDQGITKIQILPNSESNNSELESNMNPEMIPHTDGPYLNTISPGPNGPVRVQPPHYIMFYTESSAQTGGESILINLENVFKEFIKLYPEDAEILKRPGCISYIKGDLYAMDLPYVELLSNGEYRFRFRVDPLTITAPWAFNSIKNFIKFTLENDKFKIRIKLKNFECLIIDNYKMIHGRTRFEDSSKERRLLKRIWIADKNDEVLRRLGVPPKSSERNTKPTGHTYRVLQ